MAGGKVRRPQADKGWAWVVMLASFGCHLIIGGLQHTSGLVRYALQENVQKENLHYVSWLGSVYSGLISLTGESPLYIFLIFVAVISYCLLFCFLPKCTATKTGLF